LNLLFRQIARIEAGPACRRIGIKASSWHKLRIGFPEQLGANLEHYRAPSSNPLQVGVLVKLRGPTIFNLGEPCAGNPMGQ